jgi:hypothetical protein
MNKLIFIIGVNFWCSSISICSIIYSLGNNKYLGEFLIISKKQLSLIYMFFNFWMIRWIISYNVIKLIKENHAFFSFIESISFQCLTCLIHCASYFACLCWAAYLWTLTYIFFVLFGFFIRYEVLINSRLVFPFSSCYR